MMDPEQDGSRNTNRRSPSDSDYTIPSRPLKQISSLQYIRFSRIFMNIGKHFRGNTCSSEAFLYPCQEIQLRHNGVRNDEGLAKAIFDKMIRQFFYSACAK